MRLILTTTVLSMLAQPVCAGLSVEAGSHCAFNNQERDWGNSKFDSAYAAIDTVFEHCEPGDHLSVFYIRTAEVTYFISYICSPVFNINVIKVNESLSSVNCIFAGEKLDRFETCAHSSTPSC